MAKNVFSSNSTGFRRYPGTRRRRPLELRKTRRHHRHHFHCLRHWIHLVEHPDATFPCRRNLRCLSRRLVHLHKKRIPPSIPSRIFSRKEKKKLTDGFLRGEAAGLFTPRGILWRCAGGGRRSGSSRVTRPTPCKGWPNTSTAAASPPSTPAGSSTGENGGSFRASPSLGRPAHSRATHDRLTNPSAATSTSSATSPGADLTRCGSASSSAAATPSREVVIVVVSGVGVVATVVVRVRIASAVRSETVLVVEI